MTSFSWSRPWSFWLRNSCLHYSWSHKKIYLGAIDQICLVAFWVFFVVGRLVQFEKFHTEWIFPLERQLHDLKWTQSAHFQWNFLVKAFWDPSVAFMEAFVMVTLFFFFFFKFLLGTQVVLVQNLLLLSFVVPNFVDKKKCLVFCHYLYRLRKKITWRFS